MTGAGTADFFYREALRLGYVARSAFKLLQLQKQFKLITPGASILDLGCAPGAWLQVACQSLGPLERGGMVVGIDVKKVKVPNPYCDSRVRTICADVMTLLRDQARALSPQGRGFSVILSDMCPPVSGITSKDAALSYELGEKALSLAVGHVSFSASDETPADAANSGSNGILQCGGSLVIKLLESRDTQEFAKFCKGRFKKSSWIRPKATRSSSREIYLFNFSEELVYYRRTLAIVSPQILTSSPLQCGSVHQREKNCNYRSAEMSCHIALTGFLFVHLVWLTAYLRDQPYIFVPMDAAQIKRPQGGRIGTRKCNTMWHYCSSAVNF